MRLRIVARTNAVGMDRDVQILLDAFSTWRERPAFSHYRSISLLQRIFGPHDPYETIIFLERVTARWLSRAGHYALIPNQERYAPRLVPLLRHIDHVLCKTQHAQQIFAALHESVHYIGFTSIDRRLPDVTPDYTRFLHLAGGSALKGTEDVIALWSRHPEWPVLTLVQHRAVKRTAPLPSNIALIDRYLPDAELRALQSSCGVHLCPSRSEGWGHYIGEALSCAAVSVVTDGPPMNELVTADRGVLVPCYRSEPRKLGFNYYVDSVKLETAISDLVAAPRAAKARLGRAARLWFEENDAAFRQRLQDVATKLLA